MLWGPVINNTYFEKGYWELIAAVFRFDNNIPRISYFKSENCDLFW